MYFMHHLNSYYHTLAILSVGSGHSRTFCHSSLLVKVYDRESGQLYEIDRGISHVQDYDRKGSPFLLVKDYV